MEDFFGNYEVYNYKINIFLISLLNGGYTTNYKHKKENTKKETKTLKEIFIINSNMFSYFYRNSLLVRIMISRYLIF